MKEEIGRGDRREGVKKNGRIPITRNPYPRGFYCSPTRYNLTIKPFYALHSDQGGRASIITTKKTRI